MTGLTAVGYHGVYAEERQTGQPFTVDVELTLPLETKSDRLTDTVNYAEVAAKVEAIITGEPCQLIETVAGRVADSCLAYAAVEAVRVTVHKPKAPIPQQVADLSVTIHRSANA